MGLEELRDMRHDHFLNSTCDIGDPPSRAPGGEQLEAFVSTGSMRQSGAKKLNWASDNVHVHRTK